MLLSAARVGRFLVGIQRNRRSIHYIQYQSARERFIKMNNGFFLVWRTRRRWCHLAGTACFLLTHPQARTSLTRHSLPFNYNSDGNFWNFRTKTLIYACLCHVNQFLGNVRPLRFGSRTFLPVCASTYHAEIGFVRRAIYVEARSWNYCFVNSLLPNARVFGRARWRLQSALNGHVIYSKYAKLMENAVHYDEKSEVDVNSKI